MSNISVMLSQFNNPKNQTVIVIYCKYLYNSENILPLVSLLAKTHNLMPNNITQKCNVGLLEQLTQFFTLSLCLDRVKYQTLHISTVAWQANGENTEQICQASIRLWCQNEHRLCIYAFLSGHIFHWPRNKVYSSYDYPANHSPRGETPAWRILARSKRGLRNVPEWANQAVFTHRKTTPEVWHGVMPAPSARVTASQDYKNSWLQPL